MKRFLKLIPKAFRNRKKIVEGIINDIRLDNGSLSEEEESVIVERRLICKFCPENSNSDAPYCTLCGCNINLKTASFASECGAAEYNKDRPVEEHKEVKWQVYEKERPHQGDH